MSINKFILFGIFAALVVTTFVIFLYKNDAPTVAAEIEQLVQAYDNSLYLDGDYEAAKIAASEIIDLSEQSDVPNATEARGLIRLAYIEIAFGKWGNRWRKKLKRCEELTSAGPTIDRAEFLLYSGIIKGKFQRKFDEGIERVQTAIHISDDIKDDRTLALAYMNLGELSNFLDRRNPIAGNSYRAVTIARHHGQKSILVRTLRNLINELVSIGNFSEAAECGREILEIEPRAKDGLFTQFLIGESDQYLSEIERQLEIVKQKQKNKTVTNKDLAGIGGALKQLAMGCVIRKELPSCRKYAELAITYLRMVGDKASLEGCKELLSIAQLEDAKTVAELDKIEHKFKDWGELSMSTLSTAYARVGEFRKSAEWKNRAIQAEINRYKNEARFLKQSSVLFWESEINSRQAKFSNQQARESQQRVWLLSTALITGLTISVLLGGFYTLLRRERNSLEGLVERRTQSLSEAMDAANAADRAKSDFLAQINHEIRNPLTAILGYCDLLLMSEEPSIEFVAGIESSSLHLRELVDRILEVSKIESNGLDLNCVDFLPQQTVNDISDIMLEQANKKDLRFACSFRGDPTCSIFSDETKIRQIALNLIGNAIKFTKSGSVTVSFDLDKDEELLLIVVKDSGIGIAKNETREVFKRFAKASNGVACGGSGLGLFITNQLVDRLDGKLELDSELDFGTRVTVSLPVKFTCSKLASAELAKELDAVDFKSSTFKPRRRVIVVDDQEIIRTSLQLLLDANGIDCKTAVDLPDTIKLIENWKPDIVLLDLRMSKQSGYEVFEKIRHLVSSDVPIYAMTGDATSQVKEKCLRLGFDGFIVKPFKIKTIQKILEAKAEVG